MASQKIVMLHGPFKELERSSSRGKKRRIRIDIQSEPILHEFDGFRLGEGPARAIAEVLQTLLKRRSGSHSVAESTIAARRKAARAYARGAGWAKRRYSGGRTGATPPDLSKVGNAGNFSGRLAEGLYVRENVREKSWSTNVPANRLNRSTSRNQGEFTRMLDKLAELLPELEDPRQLLRQPKVARAVEESISDFVVVGTERALRRRQEIKRRFVRQLGGNIRAIGSWAI